MALQCNYYDSNLEVEVQDCYWKITHIEGNKNFILFKVGVFRNKEKADNNIIINEFQYHINPDLDSGHNFIVQAYNHLKTLPNFDGAIDV